MRLLLDSNILFWSIFETGKLSKRTSELLVDPEHQIWISSISIAEFRIKQRIGKLSLPETFVEMVERTGFDILTFNASHTHWLAEMPLHHRDPFDRMIIAQGLEEGLTILTSDSNFKLYPANIILN